MFCFSTFIRNLLSDINGCKYTVLSDVVDVTFYGLLILSGVSEVECIALVANEDKISIDFERSFV